MSGYLDSIVTRVRQNLTADVLASVRAFGTATVNVEMAGRPRPVPIKYQTAIEHDKFGKRYRENITGTLLATTVTARHGDWINEPVALR